MDIVFFFSDSTAHHRIPALWSLPATWLLQLAAISLAYSHRVEPYVIRNSFMKWIWLLNPFFIPFIITNRSPFQIDDILNIMELS